MKLSPNAKITEIKPTVPFSVVGIGMTTVDYLLIVPELPSFGKQLQASEFLRQGGGPVATALVGLAKLGIPVAYIGRVGNDSEGQFIRQSFIEAKVDVTHLDMQDNASSRIAMVLVDEQTGERCFTSRPGNYEEIDEAEIDRSVISNTQILHLDNAEPHTIRAAQIAQNSGTLVVFDGTWYSELLDAFLPLVDVAIVSNVFVKRWMPNVSPEIALDQLASYGIKTCAVTMGEEGVIVQQDGQKFHWPSFSVEVVDTTGAGDAFHAGFIYGLLQEWSLERIVQFASAVAALNCMHLGGRTGLPDLPTVEQFLSQRNS